MSIRELLLQEKLHKALQVVCEKLNQQEKATNISTHTPEPSRRFNFIYDDDDDGDKITPLSDTNEDECFNPRGDIEDIDAFLDIDTSMDVKDGYHDSKGDILYLESLLSDDTTLISLSMSS
nr:hypothetical protein [Tanacetum cinerariifolium]